METDRLTRGWVAPCAAVLLGGCVATGSPPGDAKAERPKAIGAAAGGATVGGDAALNTCAEPVGTIRLQDGSTTFTRPTDVLPGESQAAAALRGLQGGAGAPGSTASIESLRLLIQQSNCFLVVDRGLVESAADEEKRRTRTSGEARDGAGMDPGQEVVAEFVLRAMVLRFDATESTSANAGLLSKVLGNVSVNRSKREAEVQLVLSDVRSKVQVAVARGESSASNTALASKVLGRAGIGLGGGGYGSQSKTSATTILMQAYADAYNKLVPAMTNYRMQQVKGGLGTGTTVRVQGAGAAVARQP